jgi:heme exporter protein C
MVLPRLKDSLHPGNGGNASFTVYDLDNQLRMVFYPAVLGYFLLGLWIASLLIRIRSLHYKINRISVHG